MFVVFKLPHECEDITKNAWRTPLNAQCNIDYKYIGMCPIANLPDTR